MTYIQMTRPMLNSTDTKLLFARITKKGYYLDTLHLEDFSGIETWISWLDADCSRNTFKLELIY